MFEEQGDFQDKPRKKFFRKIYPKKLEEYLNEHPDAYLREIAAVFGCSIAAVSKAIKSVGYTKKKNITYKEQDSQKAAEYLQKIKDIKPETIAYIDETGIDSYIYRERAWSKRGAKNLGKISGKKYKRTGLAAALYRGRQTEPMQYEGTIDGELFEKWLRTFLCPFLESGRTLITDKASFHSKKTVEDIAGSFGHKGNIPSAVLA